MKRVKIAKPWVREERPASRIWRDGKGGWVTVDLIAGEICSEMGGHDIESVRAYIDALQQAADELKD